MFDIIFNLLFLWPALTGFVLLFMFILWLIPIVLIVTESLPGRKIALIVCIIQVVVFITMLASLYTTWRILHFISWGRVPFLLLEAFVFVIASKRFWDSI